ncbi:MAG: hypothetical protein ACLRTD_22395 [Bacteroides sp.]
MPRFRYSVSSTFRGRKINDLLLNKKAETVTMTTTIDGETYEGEGYNIEPKKVTGGLFMRSEDRQTALFLPNIEGIATSSASRTSRGTLMYLFLR